MSDDSTVVAPERERSGSPQPWVSPTLAISACPQLDRSVSTASSVSSVSGRSTSSRLSGEGVKGSRRGYMRPQATVFSESAKSRESVMSLGTIAHLQYYFARTGLLDGKGAQLAKARKVSGTEGPRSPDPINTDPYTEYLAGPAGQDPAYVGPDTVLGDTAGEDGLVESPTDQSDAGSNWDEQETVMMPPTVSTYKERPLYVPPPPDMGVLRRELREALDAAEKVLQEVCSGKGIEKVSPGKLSAGETVKDETQGFYEIQGLHVLDVITLAIRAAKVYYTAHEQPQRLYAIKSERTMRNELMQVMDALKRMGIRNFAGGIKLGELEVITNWAEGIDKLLAKEEKAEQQEHEERESWIWREGDWTGKEHEREWLFLKSFAPEAEQLPRWPESADESELPTSFLSYFQNGLQLVLLHNALVKKSRRQFEIIKNYHTDTAKPYRCAENLRYFIKAAELRWEIKLDIDVAGVVHGTDATAWRKFDDALLLWCRHVRGAIIKEWKEQRKASMNRTPTLKIDDEQSRDATTDAPPTPIAA
ncbi:hypothetical protein EJ05DRAFT_319151 [Pseudovirgaria hyperparasitica]|uniref:Calponin-homology (CH) domain-containing protein n=1 Tax=Pseudovirgaria hyperparasitica TaxID=470096 RepID=A0A6A6WBR4_9PEZI|nr:uncharacterized protein EJ05DRAFT_319151 [Pseudovirgaria hyperparasitica]KAF2760015.1 hypothetical protein EJ05DRAFT_319151 [Pseudovirgaria hyperparasitica]